MAAFRRLFFLFVGLASVICGLFARNEESCAGGGGSWRYPARAEWLGGLLARNEEPAWREEGGEAEFFFFFSLRFVLVSRFVRFFWSSQMERRLG